MTPYPQSPFSPQAAQATRTPNRRRARKAADIFLAAMIAGSVSAAVGPVSAADNYPSKPIRIVCPFPPGGGADSVARVLGDKLSERSGKPVIIDNRSGASGAIGAGIVAKAAPDGYTVLLGSSSILAASPALHGQSYQAIASELSPISLIGRISYIHPLCQRAAGAHQLCIVGHWNRVPSGDGIIQEYGARRSHACAVQRQFTGRDRADRRAGAGGFQ